MSAYLLRAKLLGLAAAAAVAIAACGGAAASSAPGGPGSTQATGGTQIPGGAVATQQPGGGQTVDGCTFLTADDIKAVTGYAVSKATPGAQVGIFLSGCQWELVAADETVPPSIVLGIMTEGGRDYYEKFFAPFQEEQGTPIAGLGDVGIDAGFGTVQVVKGDTFFNLQYLGQQDHEVELARKLLAHL